VTGFGLSEFGTSPFGIVEELADWQLELDGFRFGCGTTIEVTEMDLGSAETRPQDADLSTVDARRFGRDQKRPATWSFVLTIKERDRAAALVTLGGLEAAWDAEASRLRPGAVSELRYRLGDRVRLVYGRPRRFTPVLTNLVFGRISVVCDFTRVDLLDYDDVEQVVPLTLGASQVGGFPTPWVSPIRSTASAQPRVNQIVVGGSTATWVTVVFDGSFTDPYVRVGGWRTALQRSIAFDETITVDPRPWVQAVTRQDGAHVSGLSPDSRLSRMRLAPGTYDVELGAAASSGSATARLRWRDAGKSLW
jgi:hypothetical protein